MLVPRVGKIRKFLPEFSLPKHLPKEFCGICPYCLRNSDELRDIDLPLMALDHANYRMGSFQESGEIALRQTFLLPRSCKNVGYSLSCSASKCLHNCLLRFAERLEVRHNLVASIF